MPISGVRLPSGKWDGRDGDANAARLGVCAEVIDLLADRAQAVPRHLRADDGGSVVVDVEVDEL
jgi:hypothetical protein